MIFSPHRKTRACNFELSINGKNIERSHEARFLGVIVDEKLTWTKHIATVKAKMCRYIGIMYRIKHQLPVKARLQIFHSFVQSHLNYCSLVWGFIAKSHIDSLFTIQKKAMRAVMPGYVNYFYKDGELPASTKPSFKKYKILSIHGIITKNAMTLMHRIRHFPTSLPPSIVEIIPSNAPTAESNHISASDWLATYGSGPLRSSFMYKGPLLARTSHYSNTLSLSAYMNYNAHKLNCKRVLLSLQGEGDDDTWPNFLLHHLPGLRHSSRIDSPCDL